MNHVSGENIGYKKNKVRRKGQYYIIRSLHLYVFSLNTTIEGSMIRWLDKKHAMGEMKIADCSNSVVVFKG
jgi:hypothetical protein